MNGSPSWQSILDLTDVGSIGVGTAIDPQLQRTNVNKQGQKGSKEGSVHGRQLPATQRFYSISQCGHFFLREDGFFPGNNSNPGVVGLQN